MRTTGFTSALQAIDLSSVRTITVDVFDTILLRNTWPEEAQFKEVARAWLPYLQREISSSLTEYEVLTFRQYARRVLWAAKPATGKSGSSVDKEVTITEWLTELVRQIAEKYNSPINASHCQDIVAELIIRELAIEKRHLQPNKKLARQLTSLKERTGATVYFVSDMYLSASHIKELLDYAGVTVFDDGVTSGDVSHFKASGKMYRYLEKHFKGFLVTQNLHIGDNRHADYYAAIAEGSQAIHYRTRRHLWRSIKARAQVYMLKRYHKRQQKTVRQTLLGPRGRAWRPAAKAGALFAAPLVAYVHTAVSRARHQPRTQYIGVSSEAVVFQQAHKMLFTHPTPNLSYAPTVNRKTLIRAAAGQAAALGKNYALGVQKIVSYGEDIQERPALLAFIGAPQSNLLAKHMPKEELRTFLYEHLRTMHKEPAARALAKELKITTHNQITLLDVGWLGTIQVFAREFAALRGFTGDISGMYMGVQRGLEHFGISRGPMEGLLFDNVYTPKNRALFIPELWEYALSNKAQHNASGRHRLIHESLLASIRQWRAGIHCAPDAFWQALYPELLRLLKKPTRPEIEVLGSIQHDTGFTVVRTVPLVDLHKKATAMWVESLLRPKALLRGLVSPHCWTRGTLRYYRLWHLVLVFHLLGILRRKRYL